MCENFFLFLPEAVKIAFSFLLPEYSVHNTAYSKRNIMCTARGIIYALQHENIQSSLYFTFRYFFYVFGVKYEKEYIKPLNDTENSRGRLASRTRKKFGPHSVQFIL